jgi:hypothetical protein
MKGLYLTRIEPRDIYGKKLLDQLITALKPSDICVQTTSGLIASCDKRFIENPDLIKTTHLEETEKIKKKLEQLLTDDSATFDETTLTQLAILTLYGEIGKKTIGFEFKAPQNHPLKKEFQIHNIGYDFEYTFQKKEMWYRLIKSNFPDKWNDVWMGTEYLHHANKGFLFLLEKHNEKITAYYDKYDVENENNFEFLSAEQVTEEEKREEYMAQRIREISHNAKGAVLAINDVRHDLRVYNQLKDLNPIAFPLYAIKNEEDMMRIIKEGQLE